jgi:hypothetical protein
MEIEARCIGSGSDRSFYSSGLTPATATIYVDDVAISTTPFGSSAGQAIQH